MAPVGQGESCMASEPAERGPGHFHGNMPLSWQSAPGKAPYLLHRGVNGKSFTPVIASGAGMTLERVDMMAFDTFNAYL